MRIGEGVHLIVTLWTCPSCTLGVLHLLGGGQTLDPETMQMQRTLDDAFDNIVVLEPHPLDPDDDWMASEST